LQTGNLIFLQYSFKPLGDIRDIVFTLQLLTLHWSQWTCTCGFLSGKICNELAEKRSPFCHWLALQESSWERLPHGKPKNCFLIHRNEPIYLQQNALRNMTDTHKNTMQLDWHRENSFVYVHFIVTVFSGVFSRQLLGEFTPKCQVCLPQRSTKIVAS